MEESTIILFDKIDPEIEILDISKSCKIETFGISGKIISGTLDFIKFTKITKLDCSQNYIKC